MDDFYKNNDFNKSLQELGHLKSQIFPYLWDSTHKTDPR